MLVENDEDDQVGLDQIDNQARDRIDTNVDMLEKDTQVGYHV